MESFVDIQIKVEDDKDNVYGECNSSAREKIKEECEQYEENYKDVNRSTNSSVSKGPTALTSLLMKNRMNAVENANNLANPLRSDACAAPPPKRSSKTEQESRNLRAAIIDLHKNGKTIAQISRGLNISRQMATTWVKRYMNNEELSSRPKTGRPKSTTSAQDEAIKKCHQNNPVMTSGEIAEVYNRLKSTEDAAVEQSGASHIENLRTSKAPNSKQPTSTEEENHENMIIEPDIGIPEIKTKTEADRIIELWQSGLTVSDIAAQVQGTRKIIRKCIDRYTVNSKSKGKKKTSNGSMNAIKSISKMVPMIGTKALDCNLSNWQGETSLLRKLLFGSAEHEDQEATTQAALGDSDAPLPQQSSEQNHRQQDESIGHFPSLSHANPSTVNETIENILSQEMEGDDYEFRQLDMPVGTGCLNPNPAEAESSEEEELHKCTVCDYETNRMANLRVHMRKHNGKAYRCPDCGFETVFSGNMKEHVRKHTGEELKCKHCEYRTIFSSNLLKHAKRKHAEMFPVKRIWQHPHRSDISS